MKTIFFNRVCKNIFAMKPAWSVLVLTFFGFLSLEALSQTTVSFTSIGNGTWTAPCGVTSITIEAWGAGGGGQRANGNPSAGGGGSGGGYVITTYAIAPGTTYNLYVGTGGTGDSGGDGQASWFNNDTTILAIGGQGAGSAITANSTWGAGAIAFTTGNIGGTIISSYGGNGGNAGNNFSGGGGSSAGDTNGNNASGTTAGTAPTNGFAGANGRDTNGAGGIGGIGAGGAGGRTGNGSDRNGGNGGRGEVRITYTVNTDPKAIPYFDGFESGGETTLPVCWLQQYVTGAFNLLFSYNANSPSTRPYEGDQFVNWDSFLYTNNRSTRLISPEFNTIGHAEVDVDFQWNHDTGFSTNNDRVVVEYSLDDGTTWIDVQTISRYSNSVWGWNLKTINLPAGAGNQASVRIGFRFISAFGNRCSMDSFLIRPRPVCASNQTLTYLEPFETPYIPECWNTSLTNPTQSNGTGPNNTNGTSRISVSRNDTGLTETCGGTDFPISHLLQSGSNYMIKYNSFSPTAPLNNGNATGFKERLISPNIETISTNYVQVEFDWLEMERFCFTNVNSTNIREGVSVEWSLDGISWERTAFFPRHVVGRAFNGTWDRKKVVLPAGAGNQSSIKIALHFHSEWGYNMYVDNFEVRPKPDCTSTTTWNGTWSAGAPNATTNAIIDDPYSGGSFICCSLEINAPITIANNQTIEVLDLVSGSEVITIASEGSFVQRNNASPAPNIILNKITTPKTRFDYVYWGSPISENAFSQIPTEFGSKFHWQSGAGGNWITATSANMAIGRGFITRVKNQGVYSTGYAPITFTYTGTANNGIFYRPIVIEDDNAINFNNHILLANPYPSAISARNFLSLNTDLGTVYFWTSATPYSGGSYLEADYASWNFTGGTTGNGSVMPSNFISSAQGFFVRAFANGEAYFNNEMRVSGNNTTFFRTTSSIENTIENEDIVDRYWINLTSTTGKFSQILVGHLFGATYGYDRMYDGERNSISSVQLYSIINNDYYGINGRPPFEITDSIPLGVTKAGTNTETFTLTLANTEGLFTTDASPIYIYDKVLNAYHNLKNGPFNFTMNSSVMNDRFEIVYEISEELNVSNPELNELNIIAYIQNKEITFKTSEGINTIEVYDLNGKVILKIDAKDALQVIAPFNFANAVYIAKIKTTNGTIKSIKLVN